MERSKATEKNERKPILIIDRRKIRQYWKKSDSEVIETIDEIKKWTRTQHFPEMPTDSMLEFFLTNCKYDIEKTKENIKAYYLIRRNIPEIYENSNPRLPEMQESWDMGFYCPLPQMAHDIYRVSIVKLNSDTSKFKLKSYFSNFLNVFEIRICEDLSVSEIIICDYKELKWGHIFKFSPFMLHKMINVLENVSKNRVKNIHVVDTPSYVNVVINIAKKFLKKKIADRIQVHKNYESLYEYVPKELLPSDYGGKERPLDELIALWKNKVYEYQDRFDMFERLDEERLNEELYTQ